MADHKLIGQNYTTPDLVAKVTGQAKYAEDFRAEGMLFAKLLLSPMPHARVRSIDASEALAMPGVKAILTADDLPAVVAGANLGEGIIASLLSERGLTMEPLYEGEPILAVAAVDELTATEAIETHSPRSRTAAVRRRSAGESQAVRSECANRGERLGASDRAAAAAQGAAIRRRRPRRRRRTRRFTR